MKTDLPKVERLTENEKLVIQWAFNMVHSIVAGDYHMPRPMCYAINNLQDAVWKLARERHINVKDGCSKDYLGFQDGYWKGLEDQIKGGNV